MYLREDLNVFPFITALVSYSSKISVKEPLISVSTYKNPNHPGRKQNIFGRNYVSHHSYRPLFKYRRGGIIAGQ